MAQHQNSNPQPPADQDSNLELPEGAQEAIHLVRPHAYDASAEEILGNPAVTPQMSTLQPGDLRHDLKKDE